MVEQCSVNGCQMDDAGVCAIHGIEVERRENADKISKLMWGLLLLVVGASFIHTNIVNQQSIDRSERSSEVTKEIQAGAVTIALELGKVATIVERNKQDIREESINSSREIRENTEYVLESMRILFKEK